MKKKLLKTVLLLFCLFLSFSATAQEFVIGDCTYKIISETDLTVGVKKINNSSYVGAIDIPANVNYNSKDYTVTAIEFLAFGKCTGLTSITIPNSVTKIGDKAFSGCIGLTSITIPNSVTTIGSYAFSSCEGLTSITIPNSVTTMGTYALYRCAGLTSITIPNSVTTIGLEAFSSCSSLTKFIVSKDNAAYCDIDGVLFTKDETTLCAYPNSKGSEYSIPNSVTKIGNAAFSGCAGLTSITIPNSVTYIESSAFSACSSLTSITIPNSVIYIGSGAFRSCSRLTQIIVSKDNAAYCDIDGVLFSKDKTVICAYPNSKGPEYSIPNSVTTIEDDVFFGNSRMTSITIGNSVKTIGKLAFYLCTRLTSITIPNSVISIESKAFFLCTGLTSITIGNSVTTIGDQAFYDCRSLTSIIIGSSVTSIGANAFYDCNALRTVISLNPIAPKGAEFGSNVYANATLKISDGSLTSYKGTDGWKKFVTIIEDTYVGVDEINSQMVKVIANAGSINVIGAKDNTPIEIYTLNGGLIYSGVNTTIEIPTAGLYVARIAGKSYKVIVQ